MKITTLIATATTAAVLGTAGVSIAGASTSSSNAKPTAATASGSASELNRAGRRALVHRFGRQALELAAKTIGVKPADLLNEMRAGKSIADVATEHGVQPQTVVDALVKAADAKIDASNLTDAQKQKLEQRVPQAAAKFVNSWHPKSA
jgi:hypothetical protein